MTDPRPAYEIAAEDQRIMACRTMAQTAYRFRWELIHAGFATADAQTMTEIWLNAVCEQGHDVPHDL